VHRRRELSRVTFLVLRDRSGLAQVVLPAGAAVPPEETTVRVTGTATANQQAPGGVEVTDAVVELLTEPAATPPAELWRPRLDVSLPTLLDHAPVLWRHPAQRARWELAAASLRGFRSTLDGLGFTEVATPKLVESATESGANVFEVDYFGRPAYLAQSPQFYKQQLVGVFERVYEVGPVFRAEPHDTVRHLAEYRSLDVELGVIEDHRDVLAVLREVLAGMAAAVASRPKAVERTGARVPVVPEVIPVVHFADALELVGAPADEPDLAPEHERALGAWALAEHGSDLVAVEGYPMAKRPFYTHPQPSDTRWSNSFDLLFRGTELVTGGQRLHRASDYDAAIRARGEDPAAYAAYLQAFRHGMPPHGGFAIGLERWVARLVEVDNVRAVTLFPRDLHRLTP
jgi:nondiscriminating aspartyl-tRNA synthetase